MKVGLIDNDLISRKKHNFPNLVIMKLAGYHKSKGDDVKLISFEEINLTNLFSETFDIIYISKVFTDSVTPEWIYEIKNIIFGGTGFYLDKAEPLPFQIEHSFPDYEIYNVLKKDNKYFTDASIGFLSRGCFRHCEFCVNKNMNKVTLHSSLREFYDPSKSHITLLDDNVLGLTNNILYDLLDQLNETRKKVQFRQGLDIRLLTKERAEKLIKLRYDSHYHFAFDNIKDAEIIENKLKLWQSVWDSTYSGTAYYINTRFYIFMGLDSTGNYDELFWLNEIESVFIRIEILFKYKSIPFIMRYIKWKDSMFYKFLIELTQWSNSALNVTQYSFLEYIEVSNRKESKKFITKNSLRFKRYFNLKLKP
jgi:hypothetical protein